MWAQIPKREFFAAKPLAVVLEENSKDLMEVFIIDLLAICI